MKPFFSILIPAYNVESYIIKCLDSIIEQTFLDWECIVINDGSTDKTEQICHRYAKMDKRIKIFHQENAGVAVTRNRLIDKSSGKYFIFVDGDDWWNEKDMLKNVNEYIQKYNLDIVAWRAFFYNTKTHKRKAATEWIPKDIHVTQTGEEYIQCLLEKSKKFLWWLVLYAISKDLWIECNVSFTPNRLVCEDQEILYKVILSAKRIQIINKEFYSYRILRETSAMTVPSLKGALDMLEVAENNIKAIETMDISYQLKKLLTANMAHAFMWMGYWLPKLKTKEEQKILYKRLCQTKWMINLEEKTIKNVFEQIPVRILGIKMGFGLLQIEEKAKLLLKKIISHKN